MRLSEKQLRNFWRKVRKTDGCWIWTACKQGDGYGTFGVNGKMLLAHRISFALANGYMPRLNVLHSCDVPGCVRPDHLFEGTNADNMKDKALKGRAAKKLTPSQVQGIRQAKGTLTEIGKRFGVNHSVVGRIKNNKIWTWL